MTADEPGAIPLQMLEDSPIGTYLIFGDPWENSVWVKVGPKTWETLGPWTTEVFSSKSLAEVTNKENAPWSFS